MGTGEATAGTATPGGPEEPAAADEAAAGAATPGGPEEPAAADEAAAGAATPSGPDEPAAADEAAAGAATPGSPEEAGAGDEAEPAPTNGKPAEVPQAGEIPVAPVPRATPLPRRAPAPAAPLRQPNRSTTLPPRRPAPGRAPARASESRTSRTALIGVGLGVIVLAGVALYASGVIGGDDETTPPPTTTVEPSAGESPEPTALTPATTKVAVLNGTTIGGLASTSADAIKDAGYEGEVTTGNNTDQQRSQSEVLYGTRPGARRQASTIARRLDIAELGRLDADTRNLSENADVVVILGQDKAP